MSVSEMGFLAIFGYGLAFIVQCYALKKPSPNMPLTLLIVLALTAHGLQLHYLIDLPRGQNLAWTNLLSLLTWLSACIIFFASLSIPILSLNFLLYPAIIVVISLTLVCHPMNIIITRTNPTMLFHILLATLIVALLFITLIQALLLFIQQRSLKHKKLLSLLTILPPLDKMQNLLRLDLLLCFFGLTIFLISSFFAFRTSTILNFWMENVFSFLLWLIFLLLLVGRQRLGWGQLVTILLLCGGAGLAVGLYLTHHTG